MKIVDFDNDDHEIALETTLFNPLVEESFVPFKFSSFLDFDLLWSVRRFYKMDYWLF